MKRETTKAEAGYLGGCLTERDGFAAENDDGSICAWLRLPSGSKLEICWCPGNSPGLTVVETRISDEELAKHIRKHLEGWYLLKNKLGLCVGVDEGREIVPDIPPGPGHALVTSWSQLNGE